jgi:hypothetical protein
VIGLKTIVLSYIYPLNLIGWHTGFAVSGATAGKEAKLRLVSREGKEIGTLTLFTQALSAPDQPVLRRDGPTLMVPEYGATVAFLPLGKPGWVIPAPGVYFLEQLSETEVVRIGTLQFAVVDPLPLTAERIVAIKSELNATKAVRIELACNFCSSKLRAYSALDRTPKLEGEGWVWYQELDDEFRCECGKTVMVLEYLRRNLHGFLGHRSRNTEDLSLTPLYEQSTLTSVRSNFARHLASEPPEELLQAFVNENPILLHQFPADRIIPKPPILTSYFADFAIVTPQKELILLELETTATRLMKKNGDMAAPLSHAFDQVRNWLHEVDEHRLAVLDSLKVERDDVSTIRGVVIAGRDSGYDALALRRLKGANYGRVTFLTYDDLLFALDALIRRLQAS